MWGGGFQPNNHVTSWPNLQAEVMQDFNPSQNRKLRPSVAIVWSGGKPTPPPLFGKTQKKNQFFSYEGFPKSI